MLFTDHRIYFIIKKILTTCFSSISKCVYTFTCSYNTSLLVFEEKVTLCLSKLYLFTGSFPSFLSHSLSVSAFVSFFFFYEHGNVFFSLKRKEKKPLLLPSYSIPSHPDLQNAFSLHFLTSQSSTLSLFTSYYFRMIFWEK